MRAHLAGRKLGVFPPIRRIRKVQRFCDSTLKVPKWAYIDWLIMPNQRRKSASTPALRGAGKMSALGNSKSAATQQKAIGKD